MQIKEISMQASRTFEVPGAHGKSKYIKLVVGATAELTKEDDREVSYKELSDYVNSNLKNNLKQISTTSTNKIKEQLHDANTR